MPVMPKDILSPLPAPAPVEPDLAQPYGYRRRPLVEPDWRRLPGWRDVTQAQWRDAQWQPAHCVKSAAQLRAVVGDLLQESFYLDLSADVARFATMSMLITPQLLNV